MAADNQFRPLIIEDIKDGHDFAAWDAEDVLDLLLGQATHQKLSSGMFTYSNLWRTAVPDEFLIRMVLRAGALAHDAISE